MCVFLALTVEAVEGKEYESVMSVYIIDLRLSNILWCFITFYSVLSVYSYLVVLNCPLSFLLWNSSDSNKNKSFVHLIWINQFFRILYFVFIEDQKKEHLLKERAFLLLSEKDIGDLELPKGDTRILMAAFSKVQATKIIVSKYGTSRPHKP